MELVHAAAAAYLQPRDTLTYVGCYSSSNPLTLNDTYLYQTSGWCQEQCLGDNNAPVLGLTNGDECYCGSELPATSDKVSDSNCNSACTGYGTDDCGGSGYWSVYTTGSETNVQAVGSSSSSSSSSSAQSSASSTTSAASTSTTRQSTTTTSSGPSVVTSVGPGTTVAVTVTAGASSSATATLSTVHKSKGASTAGIAAGVVVGVVAVAAIVAGAFLFLRHKRRREAEEAYQKRSQVNEFMSGGKVPAMRRSPGPEQRIDTEAMAQRRQSDGSIADNEDFSRRILKVTNPDGGKSSAA